MLNIIYNAEIVTIYNTTTRRKFNNVLAAEQTIIHFAKLIQSEFNIGGRGSFEVTFTLIQSFIASIVLYLRARMK